MSKSPMVEAGQPGWVLPVVALLLSEQTDNSVSDRQWVAAKLSSPYSDHAKGTG